MFREAIALAQVTTSSIRAAFEQFVCSSLAAVSIAVFLAAAAANYALPRSPEEFIVLTVVIASLVGIPIAAIAAQNEYFAGRERERLESLASTDPLTGAFNRRSFEALALEEQQRMLRTGASTGLAIFDLDHFKRHNDKYGHLCGDDVLKSVAGSAHSELRGPFDRLGRWGGEEFIVLLSDVTPVQAVEICERLRRRVASINPQWGYGKDRVTASFGVTVLSPYDEISAAVRRADEALYDAKRNGRNRVSSNLAVKIAA